MRGGVVTGDLSDDDLNLKQPDYTYAVREVYADLIENHLGVPAAPVFPEPYTNTGNVELL